jgi:hypothetical protein
MSLYKTRQHRTASDFSMATIMQGSHATLQSSSGVFRNSETGGGGAILTATFSNSQFTAPDPRSVQRGHPPFHQPKRGPWHNAPLNTPLQSTFQCKANIICTEKHTTTSSIHFANYSNILLLTVSCYAYLEFTVWY